MNLVKKHRVGAFALLICAAVVAAVVSLAGAGTGARATAAPAAKSTSSSAMAQVSWICTSSSHQVQAGTASGFMRWINQECTSEGPGGLLLTADNSAAPLGALICQYAHAQVDRGTASAMDDEQVKLCDQKPVAPESGILSSWNAPPFGPAITISNAWAGTVNGQRETVYAGSEGATPNDGSGANPGQGLVVVLNLPASTSHGFSTSALDGALTITSAHGTTLGLSAADGATYSFDLATSTLTKTG